MFNVEHNGPVCTITLARPEVRNSLNEHVISGLKEAFTSLPESCRVVVFTGDAPAFCSGGDLDWMRRTSEYDIERNTEEALQLALLFDAITGCDAIVVGRINGHAFGGGCGLVACCDVAISSSEALFCFSEVKLGLVAATISRHVLPKIGAGNARWLFTTAEAISAEVAQRIGLVHKIASPDQLDEVVAKTVKGLLTVEPKAAAISKKLCQEPPIGIKEGALLLAQVRATAPAKEGVSAFLEKRKASYIVEP